MLICQEFQFPEIQAMQTLLSNQTYVLQFCLINCETVVVKSFLLVNARTFYSNPKIKASNHKAKCAYI